ncbi:MAG: tRNA (guanosine(37)-N1)-methyltransferase TrmD [Alcanivoracaceae bacterium]|nr:tRNA (guanosine(37)-N1)-methyltransferase TrmD [Alcanivoracaceae bacterium]
MRISLVTLFPDMIKAVTEFGVTRRAVENKLLEVTTVNPRDFTEDKHRTVDDRPFGGGPGMVMKVAPLQGAIRAAKAAAGNEAKVIYLSPQGRTLDQAAVEELAQESALVLIAGRYEGIDERLIEEEVDEQFSIGDYVLSGGELPAMVLLDAVARRLPGVLGHEDSAEQDSFTGDYVNLLDCPHYTRPEVFEGKAVPQVLLSGNHAAIERWRRKQALGRTAERRPDLLEARKREQGLSKEEQTLLAEYLREQGKQN